MPDNSLLRIIDANFNRLREGLRVVEEIERLGRDHESVSQSIKSLRHRIADCSRGLPQQEMLAARDSENDVGRQGALDSESRRANADDILSANLKRCQEAARVLEECLKPLAPGAAQTMKSIRFDLYTLEKRLAS